MRLFSLLILIHTFFSSPLSAQNWTYVTEDLEKLQLPCGDNRLFSPQIFFARSALKRYRFGVVRAQDFDERKATVKTLCKKSGGAVCINANFFDEQGKALGLVISRGVIHQKLHRFGNTLTAIFQMIKGNPSIIHRDQFTPDSVVDAVQAGPRLIVEGAPTKGVRESSHGTNLSGVCIDTQTRLIFFRVTSSVFGCGIDQLQRALIHDSVGCKDAMNFDGGGSSELFLAQGLPGSIKGVDEVFLEGADTVPVIVGLFNK